MNRNHNRGAVNIRQRREGGRGTGAGGKRLAFLCLGPPRKSLVQTYIGFVSAVVGLKVNELEK